MDEERDWSWLADELFLEDDLDGTNMGSIEEFFESIGVEYDEYVLDEINEILEDKGLELIDEHGQIILSRC